MTTTQGEMARPPAPPAVATEQDEEDRRRAIGAVVAQILEPASRIREAFRALVKRIVNG